MDVLAKYICGKCQMKFRSMRFLDKHKESFCIGTAFGDPLIGQQRRSKVNVSVNARPHGTQTPKLLTVPESMREGWMEAAQRQALSHATHLEQIQAQRQHLEQQREEIGQRLAELSGRASKTSLEEMLLEVREQQGRNGDALLRMRSQIEAVREQRWMKDHEDLPDALESRQPELVTPDLFPSGLLSDHIRALRLAYMTSSGTDAAVLDHMCDLQVEAQALEQNKTKNEWRKRKKRSKSSLRNQDTELLVVELENLRLEEEIVNLQLAQEEQLSQGKADYGH